MKNKKNKSTYRIRNWKNYNKALVNRGSFTLWIDDQTISTWKDFRRSGNRGAPRLYSDMAISSMITLMEVYHLPLRQTQGLMLSIVAMADLGLPLADYSALCCRRKSLGIYLPRQSKVRRTQFLHDSGALAPGRRRLFDSSGYVSAGIADCLVSPASAMLDETDGSVYVTEIPTGRIIKIPSPVI